MRKGALEVEFSADMRAELHDESSLFLLYVCDVVLANRDRTTYGNVLLASRPRGDGMDLIPIDQSDAFFHPSTLLDREELWAKRDESGAQMLPGTEGTLLDGGAEQVQRAFDLVRGLKARIASSAEVAPDEWYERIDLNSEKLAEFLEYRVDHLDVLARENHWKGISAAGEGGYVLDFGI